MALDSIERIAMCEYFDSCSEKLWHLVGMFD